MSYDEYINVQATGEDLSVEPADDRRPFRALLDVGLIRTTTGNRVFGALKVLNNKVNMPFFFASLFFYYCVQLYSAKLYQSFARCSPALYRQNMAFDFVNWSPRSLFCICHLEKLTGRMMNFALSNAMHPCYELIN